MSQYVPSATLDFPDQALSAIAAALPSAQPERAALLPEILRAWAQEDLREHLSRKTQAAVRQQEKRLQTIKKRAKDLLTAVKELDGSGYFRIALEPQMRRDGTEILTTDVETARHRRDLAVSWLTDLVNSADQPRPPPGKRVRAYLIARDLAAIFELLTGDHPTRRICAETSQPYGPFWTFLTAVCAALSDVRSLDRAVRDVQFYGGDSQFVANLKFRHPGLWQKLTMPRH